MNTTTRTTTVRRFAAAVAVAVALTACAGSDESADSVPIADEAVVDTTVEAAPVVTDAPVVTEAPVVTDPPVEIPALPCADYVDETGYPLVPCVKGVLTETLQRDLVKIYPEVFIDGLFGQQTDSFVKQFQAATGAEETGVVSEALAGEIAAAGEAGEIPGADTAEDDDTATTDTVG